MALVFGRYHIIQHAVDAVDEVRKQGHKLLMQAGHTKLAKNGYLWPTNPSNMSHKARERFEDLKVAKFKTGRVWTLKKASHDLRDYTSGDRALKFCKRWCFWATHSRLALMIEVAKQIARHVPKVLTYFECPITNAGSTCLNSKVARCQNRACGYRNRTNSRSSSISIAPVSTYIQLR
jgi:transposase